MTVELTFLLFTALLASSLWIPYIVGVNTTRFDGQDDSFVRPPDPARMAPWIHRSFRAHANLLEQFLPFAVIVLIAHLLAVSNPITRWTVIVFFVLRVVHAVGMITALTRFPLRPAIFTGGWIATLVMSWQVLTHAGPAIR